jgi:predicted DCC family thiol-disulfide oxidoreductase YuxK
MEMNSNPVLYFDGVCNLCNGVVKFIIKRDKKAKFKFASLQSVSGQNILKQYNLSIDNLESFILIKDNKFYNKSSAGLMVLKELGGWWKLLYAFIIIPKPIRDFIYDLIAKRRYKIFGRSDTCMVPIPELKERFLE